MITSAYHNVRAQNPLTVFTFMEDDLSNYSDFLKYNTDGKLHHARVLYFIVSNLRGRKLNSPDYIIDYIRIDFGRSKVAENICEHTSWFYI